MKYLVQVKMQSNSFIFYVPSFFMLWVGKYCWWLLYLSIFCWMNIVDLVFQVSAQIPVNLQNNDKHMLNMLLNLCEKFKFIHLFIKNQHTNATILGPETFLITVKMNSLCSRICFRRM